MTTIFSALQGAESLLLAAARLWAVAGEVITAGALLLALDRLAAAIRFTYQAGAFTGRLLWPVLHALAAAARWAWAHIDWREVAAVFRAASVALVALLVIGAQRAIPTLCAVSERLGRAYSAALVPAAVQAAPVAPEAAPAAPAAVTTPTARPAAPVAVLPAPAALDALPVRELRQLARQAGHKRLARSGRRQQLLEVLAA
jgi:hypothetical protein